MVKCYSPATQQQTNRSKDHEMTLFTHEMQLSPCDATDVQHIHTRQNNGNQKEDAKMWLANARHHYVTL